ncbi:MAG: bifunctional oligoribonuclease/PAP phosphatase NrnA [Deltaproteobacteria bacterium]|nr:bifunctional oligoribonuclease/PAP phosphatase NrnA [Deltaproteobacteria bacterium]NIS76570.1 bifunctional oligoribonuclease/PAP phosphatase NrnA [Deltaproteobacteria bacterium]
MSEDLEKICQVIKESSSFLLTTHINPEGDAIGSELALALSLEQMGKDVFVLNQDPVPYFLRFLPGVERVQNQGPARLFDVGILLDCGSPERTGSAGEHLSFCDRVMSIDHHVIQSRFGDFSYIDTHASSTGELVFRLIKRLGVNIDSHIATLLWVAIATDTGSFRYSNTTSSALKVAAELVERGANPMAVSEQLYEHHPPKRLELLSRVLSTLEILEDGRIASITILKEDMEIVGASNDFLEGFINYPRSLEGVVVAASFREEHDSLYKVSLRAKGNADVARVATFFNGGGHVKAAGFKLSGNLAKVKRDVYTKIYEMLDECCGNE